MSSIEGMQSGLHVLCQVSLADLKSDSGGYYKASCSWSIPSGMQWHRQPAGSRLPHFDKA